MIDTLFSLFTAFLPLVITGKFGMEISITVAGSFMMYLILTANKAAKLKDPKILVGTWSNASWSLIIGFVPSVIEENFKLAAALWGLSAAFWLLSVILTIVLSFGKSKD